MPVSAIPARRHLADRHRALREAQHRARDPRLGPGRLHPVQQVRAGLPARRHPRQGLRPARPWGAPADLPVRSLPPGECPGQRYTLQVAPEDCTGCSLCVQVCPAKDKTNPKHKAINMVPSRRCLEKRANWDFFLAPRSPTAPALDLTTRQGHAVPGAALRVLRRLRRLRRDALPQAAHAALRRPPAHRQRHRLLLHLRRQPADHALLHQRDGRGPAWANSLFEDNAEFGLGMRLAVDKQRPSAPANCCSARRPSATELVAAISTPTRRPRPASPPSAAASPTLREEARPATLDASPRRRRANSLRWPITSSRSPSGSSAATAGPTTSATAASTTSSPPGATSTSSSSTPRSTPTPAARPPSPPRGRRRQVRLRRQGHGQEGPRAHRHAYGNVYVARSRLRRQGQPDRQGLPRGRGLRRPVAHHRLQPLHRPRLRSAHLGLEQQKLAVETGYWPLFRYDPRS
jgi:pyruvate-ferredoxin/flavodoxin oxidoreductase